MKLNMNSEKINSEIFKDIANKRSIRLYQQKEISDEIIEEILMAGHLAPSAKNLQPWKFVVIKNKEIISEIMNTKSDRCEGPNMLVNTRPNEPSANMPSLFILVFIEKKRSVFFDPRYHGNKDKTNFVGVGAYSYSDIISIGCAIQNMGMVAHRRGIGSCITGDILEEGINAKTYRIAGLDSNEFEIISAIRFGYPKKELLNSLPRRNPLEDHTKIIE